MLMTEEHHYHILKNSFKLFDHRVHQYCRTFYHLLPQPLLSSETPFKTSLSALINAYTRIAKHQLTRKNGFFKEIYFKNN